MASSTSMGDMRQWMVKNKLKAVFGVWAAGLSTSLAYQMTRPIPTQLKIIHSRVYAQVSATLAPLLRIASATHMLKLLNSAAA